MRIADQFQTGRPVFSFEFFPPKTEEGARSLFRTIAELAPLQPTFVSVTYGAGGSTRDLTIDLVTRIKREAGLEAMAHLTCVGHSRHEIAEICDRLQDAGIENVLPLRGDPPQGETVFTRHPEGFGYAHELVAFIRSRWQFCLAGAAYPEGHIECRDRALNLEHLRLKVEAGIDFAVTQLFFDAADYFSYVANAREKGITLPIVPGVWTITNLAQIERIASLCGARLPDELRQRLDRVRDDEAGVTATGIQWATEQCRALLDGGAPGIHFYTLNKSYATREVFARLRV